ncbi:Imm7 family immunity protein [Streptomyces murinus]|uniref:Imm7 family immunity protein n=1 Tax=Streptomyces murinus TaxID=33900 RepID=UPI00380F85F8
MLPDTDVRIRRVGPLHGPDAPEEEADAGSLEKGLTELRAIINHIDWATASATLQVLNGEYFVRADGLVNRRRDEAEELDASPCHPVIED